MNIADVLRDRAHAAPSQTAIVDRTGACTFAELDRAAAVAAARLERAGLRPGDRALVFCPMSLRLYVALIALFRLGAVAVFVDPAGGRVHVDRCCRRVRPAGLVAVPRAHLLRIVSTAVRAIPVAVVLGRRWSRPQGAAAVARERVEPCTPDTPALITFTSGSTGEPKAAVRTHGFLLAQHEALATSLELQVGQVDLATLPVFVLANLASGVTSVIADADLSAPGAIEPAPLCRQINACSPDRVAASPALLERLAAHARNRGLTFDGLRHVFAGGAPVPPRTLDALQAMAPRATIAAVYGSTEAEPIAHVARHAVAPSDRQAMSAGAGLLAGRPVESLELRILPDRWGQPIGPYERDAFDALARPSNAAGEIVVSGPHVLPGYLDGLGDLETKFRVDGRPWHRTGDAGYLDPSGRLWLLGRCSARITDESGTLYPFAVEIAAMDVPWVRRAALVARRGDRLLIVELHRDAPANAAAMLAERLAWARVAHVLPVPAIPVDARHNAKIDYPRLRRMLDLEDG